MFLVDSKGETVGQDTANDATPVILHETGDQTYSVKLTNPVSGAGYSLCLTGILVLRK